MNPSAPSTAAREATRAECRLHARMAALVAAGRLEDAAACRDELAVLSVTRSELAEREHAQARRLERAAA